ncbi:hypothetical protein MCUN1_003590 [Malassezia cuniculi]|uniref:Protein ROT1 n=1 Tax=Malassezia cuniculi TaxID=948313 RepID=A0AAF0J7Y2_9BASI|nr:hypothetical protein MCUN1_003590 [Malassezia cuniculi]
MLAPLVHGARAVMSARVATRSSATTHIPAIWRPMAYRPLTLSAPRFSDVQSKSESSIEESKSSSNTDGQAQTTENNDVSSQRDELWNQMLNTIIIEPDEGASREERLERTAPRNSLDMLSSISEKASSAPVDPRHIMDDLEREFRERATLGFAEPAKPTTGRSFSASPTSANKVPAAVLYRNLMSTLRRNNVRYELRLGERYEKPNQMRRRKRSERHRRRFADMVRKKVQLVMALRARESSIYPDPLPEDETPATWQRVAQLIAGTAGACTVTYFMLFADFGEGEHCFRPLRRMLQVEDYNPFKDLWEHLRGQENGCTRDMLRMLRVLSVLVALCALTVMGALEVKKGKASTYVIDLEGTWSSGSQKVLTGLPFFNPFQLQFTVPETAGVSYSFHTDKDGKQFFETSQFRYHTDPAKPQCFNATMIWQHGTYNIAPNNGSIVMTPFPGDGYIQLMTSCPQFRAEMYSYSQVEVISQWFNYLDTAPGFSQSPTQYAMQFYAADGQPMPLLFQVFNPPQMLPNRQIFMQVL